MKSRCPKCGGDEFSVKTTMLPEKSGSLKIELELYYVKTCVECGYTEFYSAKVVEKDEELQKSLNKATL